MREAFRFSSLKSRRFILLLFSFCLFLSVNAQFQIDASFADSGKKVFSVDNYDQSVDVVNWLNDTLLLAGNTVHADSTFDADVFITRLLPDGEIDSSFGLNGLLRFDFDGFDFSTANELLVLPSSDVYLLGSGYASGNSTYVPFCLSKIKTDGTLDSAFGVNGTLKVDFAGLHETAKSIEVDSNGMILLCGSTVDTSDLHSEVPVIARLFPNGALDTSFGEQGKVYIRFPQGIVQDRSDRHLIGGLVQDLVVLPDGRIIAAGGYSNTLNLVAFFVCLHADGTIDSSFYGDGYLALDLTQGYNSDVLKLALKGNDLFFVAESSTSSMRDFYFGNLDLFLNSYDLDILDFQLNEDAAKDMLIDAAGEVLFCGNSILPAHNTPGYQSDYFAVGVLTKQTYPFSSTGSLFAINPTLQNGAAAFTTQSSGRIICAGFVNTAANETDIAMLAVNRINTSIADEKLTTTARVFPNPATESVYYIPKKGRAESVYLYGPAGNLIRQWANVTGTIVIERQYLATGLYFLRSESKGEMPQVQKIIFQ
ncbi:MAG: T9SS type A sorting domain-containing protein [Chitinophagales bacterium]